MTAETECRWEPLQAHQHDAEGFSTAPFGSTPLKGAFRAVPTIRIPDFGACALLSRPKLLGHIPKSSFNSPRVSDTEMASSSRATTPITLPTPTTSRLQGGTWKRKYPLAPKKSVVAAGGVGKRRMRISRIGARILYQVGSTPPANAATLPAAGPHQSDVEAMLHPLESATYAPGAQGSSSSVDAQFDVLRVSEFGEHHGLFNGPTKKRLEDYLSPRHRKTCGSGVERELALMMSSTHLRL